MARSATTFRQPAVGGSGDTADTASIALFHSVLGVRTGVLDAAARLRAAGHDVQVVDQYDGRVFATTRELQPSRSRSATAVSPEASATATTTHYGCCSSEEDRPAPTSSKKSRITLPEIQAINLRQYDAACKPTDSVIPGGASVDANRRRLAHRRPRLDLRRRLMRRPQPSGGCRATAVGHRPAGRAW